MGGVQTKHDRLHFSSTKNHAPNRSQFKRILSLERRIFDDDNVKYELETYLENPKRW
jgi:hypothetical protein